MTHPHPPHISVTGAPLVPVVTPAEQQAVENEYIANLQQQIYFLEVERNLL